MSRTTTLWTIHEVGVGKEGSPGEKERRVTGQTSTRFTWSLTRVMVQSRSFPINEGFLGEREKVRGGRKRRKVPPFTIRRCHKFTPSTVSFTLETRERVDGRRQVYFGSRRREVYFKSVYVLVYRTYTTGGHNDLGTDTYKDSRGSGQGTVSPETYGDRCETAREDTNTVSRRWRGPDREAEKREREIGRLRSLRAHTNPHSCPVELEQKFHMSYCNPVLPLDYRLRVRTVEVVSGVNRSRSGSPLNR